MKREGMGIFCEDCPDPCLSKFDESYDSSNHITAKAHDLAFHMLLRGRNLSEQRGPINEGEQIDPETGMVLGPKIVCCNPCVNEAYMVLSAATTVLKRDADS